MRTIKTCCSEVTQTWQQMSPLRTDRDGSPLFRGYTDMTEWERSKLIVRRLHRHDNKNDHDLLFRGYTDMTTVGVSKFVVQRLRRHDNKEVHKGRTRMVPNLFRGYTDMTTLRVTEDSCSEVAQTWQQWECLKVVVQRLHRHDKQRVLNPLGSRDTNYQR